MVRRNICIGIAIVATVLLGRVTVATTDLDYWQFTRMTENELYDSSAQVSGDTIVWLRWINDHYEVVYQTLETMAEPCQLTNNTADEADVQISGNNIVWRTFDDGDWDIMHYDIDSGTLSRLTDTTLNESHARVDGSVVVWQMQDGQDPEIFYYDLDTPAEPCRLTDNIGLDGEPHICGSQAVWHGWDMATSKYQIYRYDGQTDVITQITSDPCNNYGAFISDGNIVWRSSVTGASDEIYFYDAVDETITRITNNSYEDKDPRISGRRIVWVAQPEGYGQDHDIFYYDLDTMAEPCRLTENDYDNEDVRISGDYVVWHGHIDYLSDHITQIFFYNAELDEITQLTDNTFRDQEPQIDGNHVVWWAYDGNHHHPVDTEVYSAKATCSGSLAGDLNNDCRVDLLDLSLMAGEWLHCNRLPAEDCGD